MNPRHRLLAAALLFGGWLAWLGYTAAAKSRAPVVSRAQAAAATHPVVAAVHPAADGNPTPRATVVQALTADGPGVGDEIEVGGLADARGFDGTDSYLLLLAKDPVTGRFYLAGQQRSPGYELGGVGRPVIYRWSDDVRLQAAKLFP